MPRFTHATCDDLNPLNLNPEKPKKSEFTISATVLSTEVFGGRSSHLVASSVFNEDSLGTSKRLSRHVKRFSGLGSEEGNLGYSNQHLVPENALGNKHSWVLVFAHRLMVM